MGSLSVSVSRGLPQKVLGGELEGRLGGGQAGKCDTCCHICKEACQPWPVLVRPAFLEAFNWVWSVSSLNIFIFSCHCLPFHWENKYCMALCLLYFARDFNPDS